MTDPRGLAHFSWITYGLLAGAYTVMLFTGRGSSGLMQGVRTSTAIRVHIVFLAILLALLWAVSTLYPAFPAWMTQARVGGSVGSDLDILIVAFLAVIFGIERLWIAASTRQSEGDEP